MNDGDSLYSFAALNKRGSLTRHVIITAGDSLILFALLKQDWLWLKLNFFNEWLKVIISWFDSLCECAIIF